MSHCCEELAKRKPADFDIPAINSVLSLPPGLHGLPAFTSVLGTATERLLELLGDAEAICSSWYDDTSNLDSVLLQLSHAALLVLLKSDALKAQSENSVLMMADAWVAGPVGALCSQAQRR